MKFASSVAVMFGADQATADSEMRDMFKFESELANVRNLCPTSTISCLLVSS